jgi:hypothetical protein
MDFPFQIVRFGVYHWRSFTFEDGTSKDKFFIALNCQIGDKSITIVLPTSQVEKYRAKGWLIDTVVIEVGESSYFSKKTLIDLKNCKTYDRDNIEKAEGQNMIRYLGLLEEPLRERIEDAIENAYTLAPHEIKRLLCKN